MTLTAPPATVARFMRHVDRLPSGCWYWTGCRSRGAGNRKWYPTFYVGREVGRVRAHRFACEVVGKMDPLPPGHDREHTCCFSMCVNPAHIEYVTKAENQRRKVERARASTSAAAGATLGA